jgi:hypothetical protein
VPGELVGCCVIVLCEDLVYDQYRQYVRDPFMFCLEIEQDLLRMKGRVRIQTVENEWSRGDPSAICD